MSAEYLRSASGFTRPVDYEAFAQPALQWLLADKMTEMAVEYCEEPFNLRGGGNSHWFIDSKNILMHPLFDPIIARMMTARMAVYGFLPEGIIGMGIGGTALARSVSWVIDRPVSEASNAGADDRYPRGIYGRPAVDVAFTLLDDVLTSGSSVEETIEILYEAGGTIEQIGVVTDRSNGLALARLQKQYRVPTWALFSFNEEQGVIEPSGLTW